MRGVEKRASRGKLKSLNPNWDRATDRRRRPPGRGNSGTVRCNLNGIAFNSAGFWLSKLKRQAATGCRKAEIPEFGPDGANPLPRPDRAWRKGCRASLSPQVNWRATLFQGSGRCFKNSNQLEPLRCRWSSASCRCECNPGNAGIRFSEALPA